MRSAPRNVQRFPTLGRRATDHTTRLREVCDRMNDPTRTKFTVYLDRHELVELDRQILDLYDEYGIKVTRSHYLRVMIAESNPWTIAGTFIQAEHS